MNAAKIVKGIDAKMAKVAKVRDELDDFIDTLTGLREGCNEAWENLHRARDALSEMV